MDGCGETIFAQFSVFGCAPTSILPPLLNGGKKPVREFTLHQTPSLDLAIRQGEWKYLDHKGSGGNNYSKKGIEHLAIPDIAPETPGQLYNLTEDPGEIINLVGKNPQKAAEMKKLLDEAKESGRSVPMASE